MVWVPEGTNMYKPTMKFTETQVINTDSKPWNCKSGWLFLVAMSRRRGAFSAFQKTAQASPVIGQGTCVAPRSRNDFWRPGVSWDPHYPCGSPESGDLLGEYVLVSTNKADKRHVHWYCGSFNLVFFPKRHITFFLQLHARVGQHIICTSKSH